MAGRIRELAVTRRPDWPRLLDAYVDDHRRRPFQWGEHDCGTFLANWVVLVAGWDPLAAVRGRYHSRVGWHRVRRKDGWRDGAEVFERAFGDTIDLNFAHRGDGVSVPTADGPAMGILLGDMIASPGLDGLEFVPRDHAMLVWRV